MGSPKYSGAGMRPASHERVALAVSHVSRDLPRPRWHAPLPPVHVMTSRIVPPVDHIAKLTDFEMLLLGFAERYPAGPDGDEMRRLGLREGYPPCCIEFYVALIPIVWRGWSRELDEWWHADHPNPGYVRCPRCRRGW